MAKNTSQHILSTAANLLGFCLFVITTIHVTNKAELSFIDEFTSSIAILLIFSCLFSFYSLKTNNEIWERKLENIADYIFLASLVGILMIVLLIVFNFLK